MSRIVTALVAFSALALPVSFAGAQQIFSADGTDPTSTPGNTKTAVRTEQQLNVTLELPEPQALQCEATTTTRYTQRNNVARVTGAVNVSNCPAGSAGTFDVVARVKDESGEVKPIEFPEKWQRVDKGEAQFAGDYPIGDNVELVNIRVRNLKCTCAETEAAAPEAAATTTAPAN
jgi:hypothetical protein